MESGAQQFLAKVLADVPQPVWVVDHDGYILFANPAAVAVLGYAEAEELLGRQSHETVHYQHRDGSAYRAADCPMLVPRERGTTVHGDEEWFTRRDGTMFPIAWWSAPIDLPSGRGAVLAFSDTTERRENEHAARERDASVIREVHAREAQRRILDATFAVRRRLVRDLHDGAQQRLVSLLIGLRLALENLPAGLDGQRGLIERAAADAQAAIDELRSLAAGIHPAILTSRGLSAALSAVAARSEVPVHIEDALVRRFDALVESCGYFVVSELLTNAVKHAHASRITVALAEEGEDLVLQVRDDGVGGATFDSEGTGLVGVVDRVAAIGGSVRIDSPRGAGTAVVIRLPTG
ncbi:PAS domain S-box protein [Microbacterium sp. zg.B48]|uniref:PAS domain-containing sensor histidine kinase n=1 Tax=unclassified Microbacterium TaxID=2609290 RepID=UPI00214A957B|nr:MULTISPECIES: PAS domain S-box protein [unclassified Microbacterium]MCR2764280.1 PAS domain S-box protein [Microbacterium sp. zg.B48]MCR2810546.1 PAS domain S-box protein [Microbacterium sp. zg.B185]WIM19532.1 PAS domain S-box protein [Microbacterium sp. zg-B185]